MALSVGVLMAPAALAWGATGGPTSADWTQFQDGPAHDGASASATITPPLKRLWWFHAPGERSGLSGPLIVNGTAISVGEHAVYGVDAATGSLSWQVARNGGQIVVPASGESGGKTIVVFTEGAKKSESAVVAFDLATRNEVWRRPLRSVSTSGVTVDGSAVLVGDSAGRLYDFDLATGRPATWSPRALGGGGVDAPPAAEGGLIFPITRDRTTSNVRVLGIDEATGRERWSYAPRFAAGTSSAVSVSGGVVYFGLGTELEFRAVSATNGDTSVWTARSRASFWPLSAPAVAGGRVYVTSTSPSDSALYAFDTSDGTKAWDFEFQDPAFLSSPLVVGNTVYVGIDDGRVIAVDARRALEVWEDHTGPGGIGPLAASGDELIASKRGHRGGLIAFGPNPGGRLLATTSPTKLHFGRVLAGYAIAFAAVLLVVFAGGRLARRLVGPDETLAPQGEGEA